MMVRPTDVTPEANGAVDESPVSPIERRNSLEKHLKHRPDAQELKNRHILLETPAAPCLQATQQELERHRAADTLKKKLEKRPDKEELVEKNILPASNAAPALQAHARELERNMRADALDQKIQHRPTVQDLIKGGLLTRNDVPAV